MNYSSRSTQGSTTREERRQVNDPCYWCRSTIRIINRGTVLNESASGVLLRSPKLPSVGETILILPILWEDTSKSISFKQMREHPLTRLGTVVRRESTHSVGIRYEDDMEGRPQFRRWFRGDAEITTLFHDRSGMVKLAGIVGIEAAALLQSILKQDIEVDSLIIFATEIESMAPTSLTILRTTLQQCEKQGVIVYCIHSGTLSKSGMAILLHKERCITNRDTLEIDPELSIAKTQSEKGYRPRVQADTCLVVSESQEASKRLHGVMKRKMDTVNFVNGFHDLILTILESPPSLILIDLEWNNCSDILELNKLSEQENSVHPPVVILAPTPLENLIEAALSYPFQSFLGKPYHANDLNTILDEILAPDSAGDDSDDD